MKASALGGLIACLVSLPALAQCLAPNVSVPHVPDGASASREDMFAAMQAIKIYQTAVEGFQACARKNANVDEILNAHESVTKLATIADKFNTEMYAFKKKNGA